MLKIHHNTLAKANRLGIELAIVEDSIVASRKGSVELAGNTVLEQAAANLQVQAVKPAKTKNTDTADHHAVKLQAELAKRAKTRKPAEADDESDDQDEGSSSIKARFRNKYGSTGRSGDDFGEQLSAHVNFVNEQGEERLDREAIERFAKLNNIWKDEYRNLNNGQMRMTVANRGRALIRKEQKIRWK